MIVVIGQMMRSMLRHVTNKEIKVYAHTSNSWRTATWCHSPSSSRGPRDTVNVKGCVPNDMTTRMNPPYRTMAMKSRDSPRPTVQRLKKKSYKSVMVFPSNATSSAIDYSFFRYYINYQQSCDKSPSTNYKLQEKMKSERAYLYIVPLKLSFYHSQFPGKFECNQSRDANFIYLTVQTLFMAKIRFHSKPWLSVHF